MICARSDDAARMHQDVRAFLTLLGKPELAADFEFFPGWEHSPYRAFNPSLKNRIRRLRALQRIRSGEARGLVTDAASLAQRCPPVASLEA
ncbi:MAG: hypothetical protein HY075_12000, partial [Deltaproteobacteria bacterium]|nr:hypothetical protein [Deltaproteobacteria bacterium]